MLRQVLKFLHSKTITFLTQNRGKINIIISLVVTSFVALIGLFLDGPLLSHLCMTVPRDNQRLEILYKQHIDASLLQHESPDKALLL